MALKRTAHWDEKGVDFSSFTQPQPLAPASLPGGCTPAVDPAQRGTGTVTKKRKQEDQPKPQEEEEQGRVSILMIFFVSM